MTTSLSERIEILHTMGLDRRYDDVIGWEDLSGTSEGDADKAAFIAAGPAYDYVGQRWMDHADHAHMASVGELPLLFCGADITTCVGIAGEPVDLAGLEVLPSCSGTGWLLGQGPSGFERCDDCQVFEDDQAAFDAAKAAGVELGDAYVYEGDETEDQ